MIAEEQDRVHGPILQIAIFLDGVDVADRHLADHDRPQAVAEQNERNREGERERSQHAIDGKRGVDHFQIKNLADVRHVTLLQFLFRLGCIFLEAVRDEERRRTDHGAERHVSALILLQREPNHGRQQNRNDREKPNAMLDEMAFEREAVILGFQKQPMEEKEQQKDARTGKEHGGRLLYGLHHFLVAAERRGQRADRAKLRKHQPNDRPGKNAPDQEDSDQNAPEEKPASRLFAHRREHFGIDDRIVDAADRLEEAKPADDQDHGKPVHPSLL